MILRSLLFFFIFTIIFFYQTRAYISCKGTEMACPDDLTCSYTGYYCKKSGSPNINSRWSLLSNNCLNGTLSCGSEYYCLDYSKQCVKKHIDNCESYLNLMERTRCRNTFFMQIFKACNDYYLKAPSYPDQFNTIMGFAHLCMKNRVLNSMHDDTSCPLLEKYAVGNYSQCYTSHGFCLDPAIWPHVFENVKKCGNFSHEIGRDFAKKCNTEFLNKQDTLTASRLKSTAQNLVDSILEHLDVETSDLFKKVMELEEHTDLDVDKMRFAIIFLISIVIILFIVVCILSAIIYKKSGEKKKKQMEHTENIYDIPMYRDNYSIVPPLPRIPDSNFNDSNYVYEETSNASVGGENNLIEMSMLSSTRK